MSGVSVVIPTYNRSRVVSRAVASTLGQTLRPREVIVVDDGSTDDTREVLDRMESTKLKVLSHDVNRGAAAARNTGLHAAQGEYVAFLDSDDEWMAGKLEREIGLLEVHAGAGLVHCATVWVGPGWVAAGYAGTYGGGIDDLLSFRTGVTGSAITVRTIVREAGVRFDESLRAAEDLDFMIQVAAQYDVLPLPERLVIQHREHSGDHLWAGQGAAVGLLALATKYDDELRQIPGARERLHRRTALALGRIGDRVAARDELAKALRSNPADLRNFALVPLVLAGKHGAALARLGSRALRRLH